MTTRHQLSEVQLIGLPVPLWHRGTTWFEGLLREFDILATDTGESTPRELLDFVAETRERFSGFNDESNAALEEAYRRGDETLDVALRLPPEAASAARKLRVHIDRAVDFCRNGDLLTLTPDAQLRRYIDWYLDEVARQLEGHSPQQWEAQPPTR